VDGCGEEEDESGELQKLGCLESRWLRTQAEDGDDGLSEMTFKVTHTPVSVL